MCSILRLTGTPVRARQSSTYSDQLMHSRLSHGHPLLPPILERVLLSGKNTAELSALSPDCTDFHQTLWVRKLCWLFPGLSPVLTSSRTWHWWALSFWRFWNVNLWCFRFPRCSSELEHCRTAEFSIFLLHSVEKPFIHPPSWTLSWCLLSYLLVHVSWYPCGKASLWKDL